MEWLTRLRGEGRVESSGKFTVDPKRAAEMLANFTFQGKRSHLLHLVAAAFWRNARTWNLTIGLRGVATIGFDGEPLTRDELGGLFGRLVTENLDEALSWLALGLLGATREASSVALESSAGVRLDLTKGNESLKAIAAGGVPTRLQIRYPTSFRLAANALAKDALEPARHGSISVMLDGERLSQPFSLGDCLATTIAQGSPPLPEIWTLRGSLVKKKIDGELSFAFGLGSDEPCCWVSVAGITYNLPVDLPYRARVFVATRAVPQDLSRTEILESAWPYLEAAVLRQLDQAVWTMFRSGRHRYEAIAFIRERWGDLEEGNPLLTTPVLQRWTGPPVSLAAVHALGVIYVARSDPGTDFGVHPVFPPKSAELVRGLVPIIELEAVNGRWNPDPRKAALPLPNYIVSSRFSGDGYMGLTFEIESATRIVFYGHRNPPTDLLPLPAGLHLVIVGDCPPQGELVGRMASLYRSLLRGPFPPALQCAHLVQFLDYLTRLLERDYPEQAEVPYRSLMESRNPAIRSLALHAEIADFASSSFLQKALVGSEPWHGPLDETSAGLLDRFLFGVA